MGKNLFGDIVDTATGIFDAIIGFFGDVFDFLFGWIF